MERHSEDRSLPWIKIYPNRKDTIDEYDKITLRQWEEFEEQKSLEESLVQSAQYMEVAMKNIHPHCLGTGGNYAKEEQFKKIVEQTIVARTYIMEGVLKRRRNSFQTREMEVAKQLMFHDLETQRVALNI